MEHCERIIATREANGIDVDLGITPNESVSQILRLPSIKAPGVAADAEADDVKLVEMEAGK